MKKAIQFMCCLMVLAGCSDDRLFEEIHLMESRFWNTRDKVAFEFEVSDTNAVYDLITDLRVKGSYGFSNLFLQVHITNPQGHLIKKLVEYTLATPDGRWLGRGLGDLYDYRLHSPDLDELSMFSKPGTYRVELRQVMRVDNLEGVMAVGIRVQKRS